MVEGLGQGVTAFQAGQCQGLAGDHSSPLPSITATPGEQRSRVAHGWGGVGRPQAGSPARQARDSHVGLDGSNSEGGLLPGPAESAPAWKPTL